VVKKIGLSCLLILLFLGLSTSALGSDYLHAQGNKIINTDGYEVYLRGINWFGYETGNKVYHGLWGNTMEDLLDLTADLGFNVLRVPLSVQLVTEWRRGNYPMPEGVCYWRNPHLEGKTSLDILDMSLAYCQEIGLKVIFDIHRVVDGYMTPLWYHENYTFEDFLEAWIWLTNRYKYDDTVIGMDLFNEPHGRPYREPGAVWNDSTSANNWKNTVETVATAILTINPHLLILVEGIEVYPHEGYTFDDPNPDHYHHTWWGGNLRGAADYPINLGIYQNKLVYSPHDYGSSVYDQPWFYPGFNKATLMEDVWRPNWFFIHEQETAPLLIGEWGGHMDGGSNEIWMGALAELIVEHGLHHTFWCLNPNSGDTGGILLHDWITVDQQKYNLIKTTLWQDSAGRFVGLDREIPLGENGINVTTYYGGVQPTSPPTPTPLPTPTPTSPVPTPTSEPEPTPTPTSEPEPTPTPTPTSEPEGDYVVNYVIVNDWGNGATIDVTITNNTPAAVNGWTLSWTFPGNQQITNLWCGSYTQTGASVSVTNLDWNAHIAANGGSVNFGFNINYSGVNDNPTDFTLNGAACTIQ